MKKALILFLFCTATIITFSKDSIFEKIDWVKVYESNGVILSVQKNKNEKINYYKAEKIINLKKGELIYNNLLDYDNYPKIFPRTVVLKKIQMLEENKSIMYSQINFKPLKNRDYYMVFEYKKKNNSEYLIEWCPVENENFKSEKFKNVQRVKNVFGRWHIKESGDKTLVSVEIYNDFEFNIAKSVAYPYEISSTVEMLENIINYSINSHK